MLNLMLLLFSMATTRYIFEIQSTDLNDQKHQSINCVDNSNKVVSPDVHHDSTYNAI